MSMPHDGSQDNVDGHPKLVAATWLEEFGEPYPTVFPPPEPSSLHLGIMRDLDVINYDNAPSLPLDKQTVIKFCYSNRVPVALQNAVGEQCDTFLGAKEPAPLPSDVASKLHIRVKVKGCATEFDAQIRCLRDVGKREPVDGRILARNVARVVGRYLDAARKTDKPLLVDGQKVYMKDVYLVGIRRVTKGTWLPMLKIIIIPK